MTDISSSPVRTRPSKELLDRLGRFTTSELCDGAGYNTSMDCRIRCQTGQTKIVGPAYTVDVPSGEGALIADGILELQEGDVMVIAGKGNGCCSYWGDHRSLCASMMKAAGVIIDGAFRDYEECREIGLPIFAMGTTCASAAKTGKGHLNIPVVCGGIKVNPGDLVVADATGICVFSPEEAEDIMKRALEKRRAQEQVIEEMKRTGAVIPKIKRTGIQGR